jgi:hypothetical protein
MHLVGLCFNYFSNNHLASNAQTPRALSAIMSQGIRRRTACCRMSLNLKDGVGANLPPTSSCLGRHPHHSPAGRHRRTLCRWVHRALWRMGLACPLLFLRTQR